MPATALPYSTSATLPFGAGTITPSTGNASNVSFILNRFEVRDPAAVIERHNASGGPNGAVMFQEARTATGQLQIATTNAADQPPGLGDEFTQADGRGGTPTFFFTSFGQPREIRAFKFVDFEAREKI